MKVAWCLYGQPRDYEEGYKNIINYITNEKVECDFFFHAWYNNNNIISQSPWAKERNNRLKKSNNIIITNETINDVIKLYKPKKYCTENERLFSFNESSILYNQTLNKDNINNCLSCLYSTESSIQILNTYIKDTNTNYDIIFISRFDFLKPINIKLNSINKNNIYASNKHIVNNRMLICPTLLCGNYEKLYKFIGSLYSNLSEIKDNIEIDTFLKNKSETKLYINHEEIFMAIFLYKNLSTNDIIFTSNIPDFY